MILWVIALVYSGFSLPMLRGRELRGDFPVYYLSGRALLAGANPYHSDFDKLAGCYGVNNGLIKRATDPPTFILLFAPFSQLGPRGAFVAWSLLMLAALVASTLVLLRHSGLSPSWCWSISAIVALYPPVTNHFIYGQNKILILLTLTLTMLALERERNVLAGFLLAFAALTRMFPMLLLGYLLMERLRRPFFLTLVWLAVIGVLTMLLFGPFNSLSFIGATSYLTDPRWLSERGNISLDGCIDRSIWALRGLIDGRLIDGLRMFVLIASNLSVLLIIVRATLASSSRKDPDSRIYGLWVAAAVMLSPTAWFHYLTILLIPFIGIAGAHYRRAISRRPFWIMALSFACSLLFIGFGADPYAQGPGAPLLYESGFLSLLTGFIAAYCFAIDGKVLPPWRYLVPLGLKRVFGPTDQFASAVQS